MKSKIVYIGVFLLMAWLGNAHATWWAVDTSFTASGFTDDFGSATPPTDPVIGSFSFAFNDSSISGSGVEEVDGIIKAVSMTINGFSYATTDVGVKAEFEDGVLGFFIIGGLSSGVRNIVPPANDFGLSLTASGTFDAFAYTVQSIETSVWSPDPDSGSAEITDFSSRQIPEPTTLALLSLGLAGLGFTRRKVKT